MNNFKEAETSYRKAIVLDPKNGEGHFYLAIVLVELEKFVEAASCFMKASALTDGKIMATAWEILYGQR